MAYPKAERLTDEVMLNLIESVKKREFLWNPTDEHYKIKLKILEAWKEISDKLDIPEDILRLKWRNVRDIYIREYKRKKKTKDYVSKWRFFKMMSFLPLPKVDAECKSEPGTESSEDEDQSDEPVIKFKVVEKEPQNEIVYFNNDLNLSTTIPKRKRISFSEQEDYDMMYLKSLLPFFKQLDPLRKLVVRSKIQDALLKEMESQAAAESNS